MGKQRGLELPMGEEVCCIERIRLYFFPIGLNAVHLSFRRQCLFFSDESALLGLEI